MRDVTSILMGDPVGRKTLNVCDSASKKKSRLKSPNKIKALLHHVARMVVGDMKTDLSLYGANAARIYSRSFGFKVTTKKQLNGLYSIERVE